MIARGYLALCALTFLGLAIALLIWPAEILKNVDLTFETPTAFADIRADYGGCILGVGLFLCWCTWKKELVRVGLLCTGLTLLGYASGRILSLLVDGMPKRIIFILIGVELSFGIVSLVLMRFTGSRIGNELDGKCDG